MFSFKKFRTPNRDLMELQQNCADAFQFFKNSFIFEGVLLSRVVINTTNTTVPHTLNRMPLGFFISRPNALATVMEVSLNGSNLTLKASAQVTVDIWVF